MPIQQPVRGEFTMLSVFYYVCLGGFRIVGLKVLLKVRQSRIDFIKQRFLPKNELTNSTLLIIMIPQVNMFSFVF